MPAFKGFTFVEAIVVMVIIAALAAVAIPVYLNYTKSTRQGAVDQLAQTSAAAANGYLRKTGTIPALSNLSLFYDTSKYVITISSNPETTVTVNSKNPAGFTKTVPYK